MRGGNWLRTRMYCIILGLEKGKCRQDGFGDHFWEDGILAKSCRRPDQAELCPFHLRAIDRCSDLSRLENVILLANVWARSYPGNEVVVSVTDFVGRCGATVWGCATA